MAPTTLSLSNGQSTALSGLPNLSLDAFQKKTLELIETGGRLCSLFASPAKDKTLVLTAVIALDFSGTLEIFSTKVSGAYPSLTPQVPQAHLFEREIQEQWGLTPQDHPWSKPVRFHSPWVGKKTQVLPGVTDHFQVVGTEVHEVSVGPVHAGIIEPGHFRFQCHGEKILHLEISLGYQHRGVEHSLIGGPYPLSPRVMETLAGDTTLGHAIAYARNIESLAGIGESLPARALCIREIALELERIANHTGDLGNMANDVGYLPTSSYCGRLRGDFLNLTALICGNRFGRGLVKPGGVRFDLEPARVAELSKRLDKAMADLKPAVELLFTQTSLLSRFEGTGLLTKDTAEQLGMVGPAARASGLDRDVRRDHPLGLYRFFHIPVSIWSNGDVFSRAYVRWLEIQRSVQFIRELLKFLPEGPLAIKVPALKPNRLAVSLVEGWRGEICHVAVTGPKGKFSRYKIVDPSFHNWMGLAVAMRVGDISDFPLCNKSFNLSYCGHDL
jgi:Ni,Fe-hydrogenase III large subunit